MAHYFCSVECRFMTETSELKCRPILGLWGGAFCETLWRVNFWGAVMGLIMKTLLSLLFLAPHVAFSQNSVAPEGDGLEAPEVVLVCFRSVYFLPLRPWPKGKAPVPFEPCWVVKGGPFVDERMGNDDRSSQCSTRNQKLANFGAINPKRQKATSVQFN